MPTPLDQQISGFNPDNSRLISMSDGVFAFALTLLVLNLKLPDAETVAHLGLARTVLAQTHILFTWLLSFFVISFYWQAHQRTFEALKGHDARLVWLNLLVLLCVSFIWYPTELLGSYGNDQFAIVFYDGSLMLTSLVSAALWYYAAHDPRLIDASNAQGRGRAVWMRTADTLAVGLISIVVSFVNVNAAELAWLLLVVHRVGAGRLSRAA